MAAKRWITAGSRRALALATAAALIAVAACSAADDAGDSKQEDTKTVHMAISQDLDTLLPMDANKIDANNVLSVIFDGLVSYDPKTMKPHKLVASDISSTDKMHWTIKIKKGRKFQNGEPVDAASFARAWNYAADGAHGMGNSFFFERFQGYEKMQEGKSEGSKEKTLPGLKVVDTHTLKVTLNEPFAAFSSMLGYSAFFPMAKACRKKIKKCSKKPIGNGPFSIDRWKQGVKATASKWEDYQGPTPNYDRITWKEYSGSDPWPDFESGELDVGTPPPEKWQAAANDPELKSRRAEQPGTELIYLGFPLYQGAPWAKLEFRKAISMAIDRKAIIDKILPGQAKPATSWVPPGIPGGKKGICAWCDYDPAAAKKALAKAGGWPKGKRLKIYLGQDKLQEKYMKAIGDQLKRNLGIKYSVEPTPDYLAARGDRKLTGLLRSNWAADYPLNENYLTPMYSSDDPKKGTDSFGYYSRKFQQGLKQGDQADSVEDAAKKYRGAEKVLAADFPTVPLSFGQDVIYYSDRVDNVVLNSSGDPNLRRLKYVG